MTKEIIFEDASHEYVCSLVGGSKGISEGGSQPSTLGATGGGGRYGDFEPNFSHLEQREWVGGRGNEDYVNDQTRYYDGQALWGLTEDKLFPAPLWKFAQGLRTTDELLSDDRSWQKLIGTQRYISVAVGAITADKVNIWLRRRGSPGTLTLTVQGDTAGDPNGTPVQTVTLTKANFTDSGATHSISEFQEFDWTGTQAIGAGDHIVIYSASTDDVNTCWEVAVDTTGTGSKISSAGSAWSTATFTMLYRLTEADIKRKWLDFDLEGAKYVVSVNDDGSASKLFINGGRGTASGGSTTTIVDTGIGWTADRFIGAWVKAIGGTGQGQTAQITDNTTDTLTFAAVPIAFDNTTRYVIYKTPWFSELGTTGLGTVKSVAVLNNIAYFAQGSGDNIRKMYDNAGTATYGDDGTNKADILVSHPNHVDGPQMWRAINGTTMEVSRAPKVAWASALVFETGIPVGSNDYAITNLHPQGTEMNVFKEDFPYYIENDQAIPFEVDTRDMPGPEHGAAATSSGLFLYWSWWKSMERKYGATIDDEGIWRGTGLPSGRGGYVSALRAILTKIYQAIDARDGTSSVYAFVDGAYHEVFRGHKAGHRVRNIFVQSNTSANPWLWIDYNGELVYQEYSLTPLRETFAFQQEAVIESSVIDMGHAETYKFFKSLSVTAENLDGDDINIEMDYQHGKNVNTTNWLYAGTFFVSPTDEVILDIGETSRMKYRLRINTNDANTPPIINAIVLKGYEVLPVKRLWNLQISAVSSAKGVTNPNDVYDWLWSACKKAQRVRMKTTIPGIGDDDEAALYVKLEPPNTVWRFVNKAAKWTGVFALTVREM